jgi:hypothetical protein
MTAYGMTMIMPFSMLRVPMDITFMIPITETASKEEIPERSNNVKNIYEDYSYYYINFDKGAGKRVQTVDGNLPAQMITRYDNYQVVNKDQKNLVKVGRTWVEETPFNSDKTVTFTLNSPIQANDIIRYRSQVIGYKAQQNTIDFKLNNVAPFSNNSS